MFRFSKLSAVLACISLIPVYYVHLLEYNLLGFKNLSIKVHKDPHGRALTINVTRFLETIPNRTLKVMR